MGRNGRKQPDMGTIAKQLTSRQIPCTEEVRGLMECMATHGLSDSDSKCNRFHTAALLCLQQAAGKNDNTRGQLNSQIQRMVAMFKRFGHR